RRGARAPRDAIAAARVAPVTSPSGSAEFVVRSAGEADLPGIRAIYNDAAEHTTAVWDETPVDLENRRLWWRSRVDAGFPVLVASDGRGVLGYASYGPFRAFDGYRHTVEHSVRVAECARRRGIARALMTALLGDAQAAGVHVMLGAIAADNG